MMEKESPEMSREEKFAQAKHKVKVWEGEYVATHGCRPDKNALASAPSDIRTAYKRYCYYRKYLDGSQKDADDSSVKRDSHPLTRTECRTENPEESRPLKVEGNEMEMEIKSVSPNRSESEKKEIADVDSVINCGSSAACEGIVTDKASLQKSSSAVWGKHLNKIAKEIEPKAKLQENTLYSKMAEKMRASGTVKVRTSLKKLTPGNRFRKTNLISPDSVQGSTSVDKENMESGDPNQNSRTDLDSTPLNSESIGDFSDESMFNSESSVFESLEKSERKKSLFMDSSNLTNDDASVFSDTSITKAGSNSLDNSNVPKDVEDVSPMLPFRVHSSRSSVKNPLNQNVNTVSLSNFSDEHLGSIVKKKSSLNRGWLARCVGADLGSELDPKEYPQSNDDWKMKLTDREWVEDAEDKEDSVASESVDVNATGFDTGIDQSSELLERDKGGVENWENTIPKSKRGRRGRGGKRGLAKAETLTERTHKRLESEENSDGENSDTVSKPKPSRRGRGRKRGVTKTRGLTEREPSDALDEELESDIGNDVEKSKNLAPKSSQSKRGRGRKNIIKVRSQAKRIVNNASDEEIESEYADDDDDDNEIFGNGEEHANDTLYEFQDTIDDEQEIRQRLPRRAKSGCSSMSYIESDDLELEETVSTKRKRDEDLEELEQSGKIQSSWPPPKRVRAARQPTAKTANSRKKVANIKYAAIPLDVPDTFESKSVKTRQRKQRKNVPNSKMPNATRVQKRGRKPSNISKLSEAVDSVGIENPHTSQETKVIRPIKASAVVSSNEQGNGEANSGEHLAVNSQTQDDCNKVEEYDEFADIESSKNIQTNRKFLTKEERFTRKITSGTANNNFVRINLKKKTFVRGKKFMNLGKYKRQEWKKKQLLKNAEEGDEGAIKSLTCFKCGDFGHWAKYCQGKRGDSLMKFEEYNENESSFLTLEEAAALAQGIKPSSNTSMSKVYSNQISNEEEAHTPVSDDCSSMQGTSSQKDDGELLPSNSSEGLVASTEEGSHESNHNEIDDFQDDCADDDMFANIDENSIDVSNQTSSQISFTSSSANIVSSNRPTVEPLFELENGQVGPTPDEVHEALRLFGYSSFRVGQENAIMRILSGLSTLLVLSTGSGKSLCYQLPAYLYAKHTKSITICVSPLVSLMEDQVTGLPRFLRAVCLHTHQNNSQRTVALNAIRSGNCQILLVSPEAVVGSQAGGILGSLLKELPPVAFACLDEAHCVSEWSHNFRPSYLRVCQVLRERLGVKTILGLTATARQSTGKSIAEHLEIKDFDFGIIRGTSVPENLLLSVSRDELREQALITLLQGERFSNCNSIIIYCTRRDECERISTLIRTQLLEPSKVDVKSNMKRVRAISYDAEAYHAGLSSYRRQQVQKQFMSGKLRIVVATVAFGMGIDKSDVRGIIHFNMPKNLESYVQEIGRAGRDGEEAHCHLFLDAQDGKDIHELKRHIYANSLDRHTVRKLLNQVFKPCSCIKVRNLVDDPQISCDETSDNQNETPSHRTESGDNSTDLPSTPKTVIEGNQTDPSSSASPSNTMKESSEEDSFPVFPSTSCPKHEVAIPIENLVEKLDLPKENLETLLCYLELHWSNLVKMKSHVYSTCTVACYGGPRQLVTVSRRCPPLAVAIALERQNGMIMEKCSRLSFPVVEIASRMGWDSRIVKRELKAQEWNSLDLPNGGKVKKSGVCVEFSDLSFHIEARGDLSDDELDLLLNALFRRIQLREKEQLRQLCYTYQLLHSVSHKSLLLCCDDVDLDRCSKLRVGLFSYFAKEGKTLSDVKVEEQVYLNPDTESYVRSSVRNVLSTHSDHQWTGRAVARVFHGISSPNFPAEVWGRVRRIWRLHLNVEFNLLVRIATQEILRCKR